MIIESKESNYDAIFDLKTWLTHYYNGIIRIKNKEQFLKALKNREDLGTDLKLTEEEINENIEDIFGEKGPINIENAQKYLRDKNVSSVLKGLGIPKEKTKVGKKVEQPSKEEEDKQKKQLEMDELESFVKALSNRQGISTKDYNKKKVPSQNN